jgi:hypothetical protein
VSLRCARGTAALALLRSYAAVEPRHSLFQMASSLLSIVDISNTKFAILLIAVAALLCAAPVFAADDDFSTDVDVANYEIFYRRQQ